MGMAMKHGVALVIVATAIPVALAVGLGTADATTTAASVKPVPTETAPAAGNPALTTKPALPVRSITLTDADSGRRVYLRRDTYVLVSLRVGPHSDSTTWWRGISEHGRALQVRPQTAMSMRGVTLARFQAVARGEATLSSSRAVCPQHGTGPTCHSMQSWSVTVDVR